jgi:hypothetical protein
LVKPEIAKSQRGEEFDEGDQTEGINQQPAAA